MKKKGGGRGGSKVHRSRADDGDLASHGERSVTKTYPDILQPKNLKYKFLTHLHKKCPLETDK